MTTGLPSQTQVTDLLSAEFARAGYEIEDVVIDSRSRPPRISVIADGDIPLDLDVVADLSRLASALLDDWEAQRPAGGADTELAAYVLEVSSPGVDRPLTEPKHFRRARGRKAELTLSDGSQVSGRIGETGTDTFSLVVRDGRGWAVRELAFEEIATAVVQVEFAQPTPMELKLAGCAGSDDAGRTEIQA